MPPIPAPYTRIILNGIPYWKDVDGALYYYEGSIFPTPEGRICLGSQTDGLRPDWQELLSSKLDSYRATAASRPRAVGTANPAAAAAKN